MNSLYRLLHAMTVTCRRCGARYGLTYRDTATGEIFRASIRSIAPDGMMTLAPLDGAPERVYAFKEVSVII